MNKEHEKTQNQVILNGSSTKYTYISYNGTSHITVTSQTNYITELGIMARVPAANDLLECDSV